MDEEKLKQAKQKNVKLYPIYKMFSWDLLFYYSIYFLFLSQVKGLSASSIAFGNAFYPIFKLLFQPFATGIIHTIGKRRSTIVGNIFISFCILYLILSSGCVENWIICNLFMAIGFVFKNICECCILDECILDTEKKNSKFAKIDGRGSAFWYGFEAISAIGSSFLFVVNGYLPMYLCFIFCIIGTLISFQFEPYEVKSPKKKEEHRIKKFMDRIDLAKQEYSFIFKSQRLRALFMFSGLFYGMLYIRSLVTSSLLVDMGIPDEYFGIIIGGLTLFTAITTWKQNVFHKVLHNKVLTFFSITYSLSFILVGTTIILDINYTFTIVFAIIMMVIQNMIKGPYYTLIKRYLNSFSDPHLSVKIYSVNGILEDVGGIIVSLAVSQLLDVTTTAYTVLILGIVSFILFIIILDYMKSRIGLKPEEYRKEDIKFEKKEKKVEEEEQQVEIAVGIDENGETTVDIK